MDYKKKYLKYKSKYLELKKQLGGSIFEKIIPNYNGHKLTFKILKPEDFKKSIKFLEPLSNNPNNAQIPINGLTHAQKELKKHSPRGSKLFGVSLYVDELTNPFTFFTIRVFPEMKICIKAGSQKVGHINAEGIKIKDPIEIKYTSILLMSFAANFVKQKYPNIDYLVSDSVGGMVHNSIKNMKYNDGTMIPIAVGFRGDLEITYEKEKYLKIMKERYIYYIQKDLQQIKDDAKIFKSKQDKIKSKKENFDKNTKIIITEFSEQIKKDLLDYEKINLIKEYYKGLNEREKELNKEIKKIKGRYTYDREEINNYLYEVYKLIESGNEELTNLKIINHLNKIKKLNIYKKIKKYRINYKKDLIYPNPLEIDEKNDKIRIYYLNGDMKEYSLSYFRKELDFLSIIIYNMAPFSRIGSQGSWNSKINITIRINDLSKKWEEIYN